MSIPSWHVLDGWRRVAGNRHALAQCHEAGATQPYAASDAGGADTKRASNLNADINDGTPMIGWVGPARLGILIAAFGWAGRVFEWLGTLAMWLFPEIGEIEAR